MSLAQHSKKDRVGVVGLGAMGGPLARKLLISGQRVLGYDIDADARTRFMESGGLLTRTPEELVRSTAVVFTCLPDTATFVDVAETRLLPHARSGQLFVDVGTVAPLQTRRVARLFARKGAALVDAPVSGVIPGKQDGAVHLFCGGDIDAFKRVLPLLESLGGKDHVKYCGGSGCGQAVEGVSRLAAGLVNAALIEALSYGINSDIRPEVLRGLLGGDNGWRGMLADMCVNIEKGEADRIGVKWAQYRTFLEEARDRGFSLPISKSLHFFLRNAEKTIDEDNRKAPSLWRELTRKDGIGALMATNKQKRPPAAPQNT